MSTVSSSSNEGYFSSSSEDTESIQQKEHNDVNESKLNIKRLKAQKKNKEEEEISRIIAKIQGGHISSLPESQQIENKIYPKIKQEHNCMFEVAHLCDIKSNSTFSSSVRIHGQSQLWFTRDVP